MVRFLPWLAVLLLLAALTPVVSGQQCPVQYRGDGLLFGGVGSQCVSGCKTRSSEASRNCGFQGYQADVWGLCNAQQLQDNKQLARSLAGGAAWRLQPCELMRYLQGRTTWLIGDSFMKQTYRALTCFLIDFWDHQECEPHTNPATVQELQTLPVEKGQSKCFHLQGPQGGRVCFVHAVLGTSLTANREVAGGGVLPLLRSKFAEPQDIFVVGFNWWHRKKPMWAGTYNVALHMLGRDYQANKGKWPHVLFKGIPAVHEADHAAKVCKPLKGWTFNSAAGRASRVSTESGFVAYTLPYAAPNPNTAGDRIIAQYGIPTFSEFDVSVPLHSNHVGIANSPRTDCLHYCHPGVPEMGMWFLYDALQQGRSGVKPLGPATKQSHTCVPSTTAGWKI